VNEHRRAARETGSPGQRGDDRVRDGGLAHNAAAHGQSGKAADAQAALAELRAVTPDATATGAVARLRHVFLKQEDLDRLVEGLRKAGLPEK
jgi:hypothetical protein